MADSSQVTPWFGPEAKRWIATVLIAAGAGMASAYLTLRDGQTELREAVKENSRAIEQTASNGERTARGLDENTKADNGREVRLGILGEQISQIKAEQERLLRGR